MRYSEMPMRTDVARLWKAFCTGSSKYSGLLMKEAFALTGGAGQGVLEQIDGAIQFEGRVRPRSGATPRYVPSVG
jgi:hypothetical protein